MGWEKRGKKRVYTRSHKVNGRVVREYVGGGDLGEVAAMLDAYRREQRQAEGELRRAARLCIESVQELIERHHQKCNLVARAALVAAGYHQHDRGSWRRGRERE